LIAKNAQPNAIRLACQSSAAIAMIITFLKPWYDYTDNFLGIIPSFTFSSVIMTNINVAVCRYLYPWAISSFWLAVGGWREIASLFFSWQ